MGSITGRQRASPRPQAFREHDPFASLANLYQRFDEAFRMTNTNFANKYVRARTHTHTVASHVYITSKFTVWTILAEAGATRQQVSFSLVTNRLPHFWIPNGFCPFLPQAPPPLLSLSTLENIAQIAAQVAVGSRRRIGKPV